MNETQKTAVWRLAEKVKRAGRNRLAAPLRADDWKELATLSAECREMLVADTIAAGSVALRHELENASHWLSGLVVAQQDRKLSGTDADGVPIEKSAGALWRRIHKSLESEKSAVGLGDPRLCDWCDSEATETRVDGDGFRSHACAVHAAEYFETVSSWHPMDTLRAEMEVTT